MRGAFTQLLGSARSERLGHFYIFQARGLEPQELKLETLTFVREYWQSIEGKKSPADILNHPDLLVIDPIDEEGEPRDYLVEDLKPLVQFLSYRPIQVKRRFVIMTDVHTLGTTVANRLLKTLEEPEGEVSFLWLNHTGAKLLPTLESRAQIVLLSEKSSQPQHTELMEEIKSLTSLHTFLERFKAQPSAQELLDFLLHFEATHDGPGALKQELLEITHNWQKAQMLHQPTSVRLVALYDYCQKRFCTER
jgi:DNA polymerase III delta prime subunit